MLSNLTRFVILLVKIQSSKDTGPLRKKERARRMEIVFSVVRNFTSGNIRHISSLEVFTFFILYSTSGSCPIHPLVRMQK
ncbi:hypothetical protein PRUPE_1G470000 [Prunus persica]|uniref:Uncharacterized protein n=1 Tax=Prunus persica TaxID=3760 RepID=A0A251RDW0_PRUPE|nr:hypothetical protein PRUPE_1G470000 [Prunus persica]